jgi:3-oxoacyl-[acyl-carrier protein] reductase
MKDAVGLITGVSAGIGCETAIPLGEKGGKVGIHYNTTREGVEIAARKIRERGGTAEAQVRSWGG